MHGSNSWVSALNSLLGQRDYLEGLLSKTATTLYALRDRQTRNERILSTHPTPRSRRKKIQQNKWRTGKTIQTCEKEERVILDCLQVCEENIRTLETMIHQPDVSRIVTRYYTDESFEVLDSGLLGWKGWTDDAPVSPFKKDRQRSLPLDEMVPETPLPDQAYLPTEQAKVVLSAEAAEFLPNMARLQEPFTVLGKELDKLTISGFLAAKRRRSYQTRRIPDVAGNSQIARLFEHVRPASAPTSADDLQWTGPRWTRHYSPDGFGRKAGLKRSNSA